MVDTLQEAQNSYMFQKLDSSAVPLSVAMKQLGHYISHPPPKVVADEHALKFYMLNHLYHLIMMDGEAGLAEERKREFLDFYFSEISEIAERALMYTLLVCIREMRHIHSVPSHLIWEHVGNTYGEQTAEAIQLLKNKGSSGVESWIKSGPYPNTKLGEYTKGLKHMFDNGSWGGGYGGKAWGKVADCIAKFVDGTYTPEVAVDTIWTLCHNNGPIFNKPYLYSHYTGDLIKVLDVQRAGQIPNLFYDWMIGHQYFSSNISNTIPWYQKVMGFFEGDTRLLKPLDWFAIEALGAVEHCSSYQTKQKQYGIVSPYEHTIPKMEPKPVGISGEPEYKTSTVPPLKKNQVYIDPGLIVKKEKRA